MICLFLSVSLSHDLIIIGIINNITSRSLSEFQSRGQICTLSYSALNFKTCWKSLTANVRDMTYSTMVNETGTKQWRKHPHKQTHTHKPIIKRLKTHHLFWLSSFWLYLFDNKLELLEFKGGSWVGTILKSLGKLMQP